ncbi:protein translation factor SUI1 [Carpediemonas membranifera]|uniref:Protein translation factor SUI1 n=1 Tax=Carpediemonas membranifera TaxID=201153 RepID=A0A8J6AU83_9EUKA|nr:protein translation factor SUI1 [Carpediemonas membranifera]|eukprot:KAG9391695.1 protein translation factor SUI1 [Carpediemonas membranifera]
MADIANIISGATYDPMKDLDGVKDAQAAGKGKDGKEVKKSRIVHVRITQRNARKSVTTIEGLNPKISANKVLRHFKKTFSCNGTIITHDELGEIIQLQGDQRENVSKFLLEEKLVKKTNLKVHGF